MIVGEGRVWVCINSILVIRRVTLVNALIYRTIHGSGPQSIECNDFVPVRHTY